MSHIVYFSPAGLARAQRRCSELEAALDVVRREKQVAYNGSGDGWHDNPFFNKLEQDERSVAAQLAEVKHELARAQVFTPRARALDAVRIGSIVEIVRHEPDGPVREVWEIGCYNDTDRAKRRLGYDAPLATVLVGQEPDALVTHRQARPGGGHTEVEVEIVALHAEWPAWAWPDAARAEEPGEDPLATSPQSVVGSALRRIAGVT